MNLTEISACLLKTESHAESLRAVNELHALFSGIVRLSDDSSIIEQTATQLSEGKALSPLEASRCIFDYMRTKNFLRGVRAAIVESFRRFPGETIHVLYAGCGPYAPLALPLTTQFGVDQVQFTLLDIHQQSLDRVRQIVESFGATEYVRDYVQCDATVFRHTHESKPHIILIETMQRALEKEPQVAIARNLIKSLRKGGILLPEKISLSACLGDSSKEVMATLADESTTAHGRDNRIDLGTIFELTAESARQTGNGNASEHSSSAFCSDPIRIRVPQIPNDTPDLMILTKITIFGSIELRDYESGLTLPTVLAGRGGVCSHDELEFQYLTGENPGLRWSRLECSVSSSLSSY